MALSSESSPREWENLHTLAPLLAALDDRRRTVLRLRYGRELTQTDIGAYPGIS